jgi:acetoin utilization deacetylase AcuC-like enzyme
MSTLLVTHSACLEHLTPLGHPERPDRLRAIERVLEQERFMPLAREYAPRAALETIALRALVMSTTSWQTIAVMF